MNTSPLQPNDAQLEAALKRGFAIAEPIPADAVEIAYAAIELDTLSEELATLAFDSADGLVAMRHEGDPEARLLSFSTGQVTIDVELRRGEQVVVGQVSPADEGDEVVAETQAGEQTTTVVDRHGRFRVAVSDGVLRLRVVGKVVTPWITA